ncbi:hypothetical protein OHA40_03990 [Nocardia sp. NBC_00508]|uniref:hypothetical protein n=1 Tax=Nocardia sp. NBC_00508 TaxID=2975992 RepID=UPI002E81DAA5|nr:hypothetical protein [Nocardia sp. NBC_00508]WUD67327.1 hypothetical protein OHA40_03990 [Nocardia sp. NBC_00508]
MSRVGLAEALEQIASRVATAADDEASIFQRHIRETVGEIRTHLDNIAATDARLGGSNGPLWLPGWDRETKAPLWFRADAVRYHMLHAFDGRENGISFDVNPDDQKRRSAWASAKDMRGDREYEIVKKEDLTVEERESGNIHYVDRSKAQVVPAPWHDPDHPAVQIAVHATGEAFALKIPVGFDQSGNPIERRVSTEGTPFGILTAHTPGFQRLLADNPQSNVAFGPSAPSSNLR